MTTARVCRCGHEETYHRAGRCSGLLRIHEAHPDSEPCHCRAFEAAAAQVVML